MPQVGQYVDGEWVGVEVPEPPTNLTDKIVQECAACVPSNWLDPLLSGPDKVAEFKDGPGVERLLCAITKRIRALSSHL
jgi:hypothetical protein